MLNPDNIIKIINITLTEIKDDTELNLVLPCYSNPRLGINP